VGKSVDKQRAPEIDLYALLPYGLSVRIARLAAVLTLLAAFAAGACDRPAAGSRETRRVVCLTPSSTELVAAVGAAAWIVAVDQFSAFPPEVRKLPKVGDFLSPNLEAILAQHPDIVVVDAVQTEVARTLSSHGIRTLGVPMQTVDDVRAGLVTVGRALGREPEARAAVARLDADLRDVGALGARALTERGRRPRVLFVVDRQVGGLGNLVAAGPGTYLDELLRRAGADNVLADSPVRYAKITAEEVIARAPDVILDAVHAPDAAAARADWSVLASVPAVKSGRVHVLADAVFVSPGPRLGEALRRLAPLIWDITP